MKTHQVEVDDEVYQIVRKHAERSDFNKLQVDSFNTAIRRLLSIDAMPENSERPSASQQPDELIPRGTPEALAQVLEVAHLVSRGKNRTGATREVARKRQISQQAVNDKYGRQLGLTAAEFDRLLEQPERKDLRRMLVEKFPSRRELIVRVLS